MFFFYKCIYVCNLSELNLINKLLFKDSNYVLQNCMCLPPSLPTFLLCLLEGMFIEFSVHPCLWKILKYAFYISENCTSELSVNTILSMQNMCLKSMTKETHLELGTYILYKTLICINRKGIIFQKYVLNWWSPLYGKLVLWYLLYTLQSCSMFYNIASLLKIIIPWI